MPTRPTAAPASRLTPGTHLVYLDGWQRHVSALQDAADPRGRARRPRHRDARPHAGPGTRAAAAGDQPSDLVLRLETRRLGRAARAAATALAARAEPQLAATSLCEIAATAGYRRLENQLYRVEVHEGGASPTFKWSRENGSVDYAVVTLTVDEAQQPDRRARGRARARQQSRPRWRRSRRAGRRRREMHRRAPGTMLSTCTTATTNSSSCSPACRRAPSAATRRATRCCAAGTSARDSAQRAADRRGQLDRARGRRPGPLRARRQLPPGDYWQIPARTITGDVEWPRSDAGDPLAQPPAGIADATAGSAWSRSRPTARSRWSTTAARCSRR